MRVYENENKVAGPIVFSFHSISKGFTGECGLRGGYLEAANCPSYMLDQLYKVASVSLCSNAVGQLAVSVMVNPPNTEEYANDAKEKILSMERRAQMAYDKLNSDPHIKC